MAHDGTAQGATVTIHLNTGDGFTTGRQAPGSHRDDVRSPSPRVGSGPKGGGAEMADGTNTDPDPRERVIATLQVAVESALRAIDALALSWPEAQRLRHELGAALTASVGHGHIVEGA